MMPTINTRRLTLRPFSVFDRDAMVDTIMSDMDVMHWLPYSDGVSTPAGQRDLASGYISDFIKPWDELGFGVWAVCIRDIELGTPGKFIGYCGFIPEKIKGAGPELAYAMGKSMWGMGLATEAVMASLDWVFNKPEISRVYAVTDKENTASRRVMEKIGMTHEKDVNLYQSVADGESLLPYYAIDRETYIRMSKITVERSKNSQGVLTHR
jgi:RimJ/RimL family protein N-acetyltransferase